MNEQKYIVIWQCRSSNGLYTEYEIVNSEKLKKMYPHYTVYPIGDILTKEDKEKLEMGVNK